MADEDKKAARNAHKPGSSNRPSKLSEEELRILAILDEPVPPAIERLIEKIRLLETSKKP